MNYLVNEQQVLEDWAPLLEESAGITDGYKKEWLSKYCHYHSLHENASTLNESFSYGTVNTLGNVPGMGAVRPGAAPGGPLSFHTGTQGSGDKFPSLLPLAIQVAARTIGFDIVSVIPMQGPTGVLTYLDYVYAGGKVGTGSKPLVMEINVDDIDSTNYTKDAHYWGVNRSTGSYASGDKAVELIFVDYSRVDGYPIFRVGQTYGTSDGTNWVVNDTIALSEVFTGTAVIATDNSGVPTAIGSSAAIATSNKPVLVRALENHIAGFAGSGTYDQDDWSGDTVDGTKPMNPMGRATGEQTYYRMMGLTAYTKFVQAETFQVAASVTTEQIQDLNKQFGIDVISMVENALVNEVSQSINKHILSRAFALGWSNNAQYTKNANVTLNFTLDRATLADGTSPSYINKIGYGETIKVNGFADYGDFENLHTLQRRIMSKVLAAGNIIAQRARRGPANFVVTNLQIATSLQDSAQFTFAPMNNTVNQNNGSLYPVGTIAGITIYVDPNMSYNDTRILVGRKGNDEEPGLKFLPYLMAESIQTIAEGTMSPKIAVKSRYALVEAGHFPEVMYYTIYLHTNGVGLI